MAMTAAQYAALLLTDAQESAAQDLAEGRYRYLKNLFPELTADGVASLAHSQGLEKVASSFVPNQVLIDTLTAGQDLAQYTLVQMVAGGVFTAATAGQKGVLGVAQRATLTGATALIAGGGITPVLTGVAVVKGAPLMSDASGFAISAAAGVGNHIYGYAMEAASGAGVQINMAFGYHGPVTNAS